MAAVSIAVAIPATVLIRGSDEDGKSGSGSGAAATSTAAAAPQFGAQRVRDASLGVEVRVPRGWSESREASAIRLRSEDGTTEVAISAPAPAGATTDVLQTAVNAIRSGYSDATAIPNAGKGLAGKTVGGLPAGSAALLARTEKGSQLRIVLSAASGDSHTYLVEIFNAVASAPERLAEAQLALSSLKLTG
jgi:hypothetical protein